MNRILHDYKREFGLRGYRRTRDLAELRAANVTKGTLRRIWRFLSPYRGRLAVYLVAIGAAAAIGSVPPLLVRNLVDTLTNHGGMAQVDVLAAAMVGVALATTALSLVNRWLGSVIGEGIIYDLRVKLYTHVQRMPVAFFTRTQTGSLMSRLTSDVLDAQNAVGTAASVVSDIFTLVATLIPMFVLSPQITSLALLVLPPFILLDRVMARRISRLSRHQMQLNADMSSNMTERFNVSGALLVKLFGRPDAESKAFARRAGAVRDSGIRLALLGRYLYASLSLVGAVGTAAVYWLGGREAVEGTLGVGTVVALAAYVTRLYSPLTDLASAQVDVLGAIVSFDRVFEILDTPPSVADRPGASTARRRRSRGRAGDGRRRLVPIPGRLGSVGGLARGDGGDRRRWARQPAGGLGPAGCVVCGRARNNDRPGRAVGRRQDHPVEPGAPALRHGGGVDHASTATMSRTPPWHR